MTRIATPATIADAPEASRPLLEAVARQLGSVPNMFRTIALSQQALEGLDMVWKVLGRVELQQVATSASCWFLLSPLDCEYRLKKNLHVGMAHVFGHFPVRANASTSDSC